MQAISCTRPGGYLGCVGVTFAVELPGMELFFSGIHLHGGPAPVRRSLPDLLERSTSGSIDPGKVIDLIHGKVAFVTGAAGGIGHATPLASRTKAPAWWLPTSTSRRTTRRLV